MPSKGDSYKLHRAGKALNGKWALPVLLGLISHPHRFSELQKVFPEIPSRSLARLLARLEDDGVIVRTVTSGRPARSVYSVPVEDECLREALRRLSRWASRKFGEPR